MRTGGNMSLSRIVLSFFAVLAPVAASAQIYKCGNDVDGVVYTDTPCKGGQPLSIAPGAADPAALERLERTREALGRSADRRLAAEREAAQSADAYRLIQESQVPTSAAADDVYPYDDYGYGAGWYVPVARPKPKPPRHELPPKHSRRVAPSPHFMVSRP